MSSGKFVVRVNPTLHRDLVKEAKAEGVSLNQYCMYILAKKMGEVESAERASNETKRKKVKGGRGKTHRLPR
jgi:hypothetical protein